MEINKDLSTYSNKNVYVGCGEDIKENFIHCDIRKLDHIDIVCKAWELSNYIQEVNLIYSRHMLEHLTNIEAQRTLEDWYKCLNESGMIQIIVPNIDYYFKQWLNTKWDENTLYKDLSDEIFSLSSIYGWQRECDPEKTENPNYWDVHKSGYNKQRLNYILHKIGYTNIQIKVLNDIHLQAIAFKEYQNPNEIALVDNFKESISLEEQRIYSLLVDMYKKIYLLDKSKKYVLYGYGSVGKLIFPHIQSCLIGIIDIAIHESSINTIPVLTKDDLNNLDEINLIISPFLYTHKIKNDLKQYNCTFIELL
ncbi:MAG: hypothetical protein AB7D96_03800 [Arcobacteraceae bacterium]